jgi:hypothetical protein
MGTIRAAVFAAVVVTVGSLGRLSAEEGSSAASRFRPSRPSLQHSQFADRIARFENRDSSFRNRQPGLRTQGQTFSHEDFTAESARRQRENETRNDRFDNGMESRGLTGNVTGPVFSNEIQSRLPNIRMKFEDARLQRLNFNYP